MRPKALSLLKAKGLGEVISAQLVELQSKLLAAVLQSEALHSKQLKHEAAVEVISALKALLSFSGS